MASNRATKANRVYTLLPRLEWRSALLTATIAVMILPMWSCHSADQPAASVGIDVSDTVFEVDSSVTLTDTASAEVAVVDSSPVDAVTPGDHAASPWRWTPGENLRPRGGMAVHGDIVYVPMVTYVSTGTDNWDYPFFLYAVNARTGRVVWRETVESEQPFAPAVDERNGDVLVSTNYQTVPVRGNIARFDADGSRRSLHVIKTNKPPTSWEGGQATLHAELAVSSDGTAYFLAGRTLNALLPDGTEAWSRRLGETGHWAGRDSSVIVAGSTVFAFNGVYLYLFGNDGSIIYRTPPIEPAAHRSQTCGIRGRRHREIIVPSTDVWAFGLDGALGWKNTPVWGAVCPIESSSGHLVFFDASGEQLGESTASWMNESEVVAHDVPSFARPSWHQLALESGEMLALHAPVGPIEEYSSARSAIIYRPDRAHPVRFELPVAYGGQLPPVLHAGLLIYASEDGLVAVPLPKKPAEGHWYTTHGDFANTRRMY